MGEIILTMKGIDKSFPGVHALDHVDRGEKGRSPRAHGRKWSGKVNSDEGIDGNL